MMAPTLMTAVGFALDWPEPVGLFCGLAAHGLFR